MHFGSSIVMGLVYITLVACLRRCRGSRAEWYNISNCAVTFRDEGVGVKEDMPARD